jgi:hypothetical protein
VLVADRGGGVLAALSATRTALWGSLHFNWLFWSSVAVGMVMFAVALHLTDARLGLVDPALRARRRGVPAGRRFVTSSSAPDRRASTIFHYWLAPGYPTRPDGDGEDRVAAAADGMLLRDYAGMVVSSGWRSPSPTTRCGRTCTAPDRDGAKRRGWYERLRRDGDRGAVEEAADACMLFLHRLVHRAGLRDPLGHDRHRHRDDAGAALLQHHVPGGLLHGGVPRRHLRDGHRDDRLPRKLGLEPYITARQYHDLGKLVFAFAVFWMYINWSQYIVIWYGLLPHEQEWFVRRLSEPFDSVSRAVVMMIFLLPFFGLLTRPPKKVPRSWPASRC